jgi:thiol-disulfide isomerase/thioredoxin
VFLIFPLFGIIVALSLALTGPGGLLATPPPTPTPFIPPDTGLIDQPAPNFELTGLDGASYRLSSFRGRVVFINFWATWCEPCKKELPAMQQFAGENDRAAVLAINVDEPVDTVQTFLTEFGATELTVLLDPDLTAYDAYGVNRLPITFVVDPGGVIRYAHVGEITLDDLNAYRDELAPAD